MNFRKSLTAFITIALFTSLVSSCGDDNPESIVGTWEHKAGSGMFAMVKTSHPAFTKIIEAEIEKYMTDTEDYSFIFTKEGKYQLIQNGTLEQYGTYAYIYKGGILSIIEDAPIDEDNSPWDLLVNLSGNTLLIESDFTSLYSSKGFIESSARYNEELKDIDPSLIKVSKAALVLKYTRK